MPTLVCHSCRPVRLSIAFAHPLSSSTNSVVAVDHRRELEQRAVVEAPADAERGVELSGPSTKSRVRAGVEAVARPLERWRTRGLGLARRRGGRRRRRGERRFGWETLPGAWSRTNATAPPAATSTTHGDEPQRRRRRGPGLGMAAHASQVAPVPRTSAAEIPRRHRELLERISSASPAAQPLLPRLPAEPPVHLVGGAVRDLLLGGAPARARSGRRGRRDRAGGRARRRTAACHDRFGTATVRWTGYTLRPRHRPPGALPAARGAARGDRAGAAGRGPRAPRLHGQRHRGGAERSGAGRAAGVAARAGGSRGRRACACSTSASFRDDPTRLLRLARYAARLGFEVEPRTRALAERRGTGALRPSAAPRIGDRAAPAGPRARSGRRAARRCASWGSTARSIPASGSPMPALARRALALLRRRAPRAADARAGLAAACPPTELTELLDRSASRPATGPRSWPRATRAVIWLAAGRARKRPRRSPAPSAALRPRRSRWRARWAPQTPAARGSRSCATSASRSTATTCWPPASRRARDRPGSARRAGGRLDGRARTARRSSPQALRAGRWPA